MCKKIVILCLSFLVLFFLHQKTLPWLLLLKTEEGLAWDSHPTEEDLEKAKQILKSPFKFLSLGNQCFVFLSKDENYVLKICKASRYRSLFQPTTARKKKHKESDFSSYSLAFQYLPNQSQIVFLHLNTTKNLNTPIELVDPLGIPYFLNADNLAFYIQKKATPLSDHLKHPSLPESQIVLEKLLELFQSTCKAGLQIRDVSPKNIGIYKDTPIWIDVGRIRKKPSLQTDVQAQKEEIQNFCLHLSSWFHA